MGGTHPTIVTRTLMAASLVMPLLFVNACDGRKEQLDAEVRRLCAIDGGIKVYEVVELSPDNFDQYGLINFYNPSKGEEALGEEYIFKSDVHYYARGNPEMWRYQYQIIRRSDQKILSESISYSRKGGDLPGPWHDSSFGCPDERGDIPLIKQTFVRF